MTIAEGNIGPPDAPIGDTTQVGARFARFRELIVADGMGRYREPVSRGKVFSFAAQAALTFPAGLASTAPVFTLYNPPNSGVNGSLLDVGLALSAAPAAATVFAIVGSLPGAAAPSSVTAGTTRCNLGAAAAGALQIYTVATIAAPTVLRVLGSILAASSITPPQFNQPLDGIIEIPPGSFVCVAANAAASGFPHFTWQEIRIPTT